MAKRSTGVKRPVLQKNIEGVEALLREVLGMVLVVEAVVIISTFPTAILAPHVQILAAAGLFVLGSMAYVSGRLQWDPLYHAFGVDTSGEVSARGETTGETAN